MRRGNRDQRLHSYRWQQTTKRILTRDAHRCQWGLEGCTEWADAVDHVYPRQWMEPNDPRFWDERNLVASCRNCNNRRATAKPGERGAYANGERPERRGGSFIGGVLPRAPVSKLPLHTIWSVRRADYSRKKAGG